jgi:hypothetical protein
MVADLIPWLFRHGAVNNEIGVNPQGPHILFQGYTLTQTSLVYLRAVA